MIEEFTLCACGIPQQGTLLCEDKNPCPGPQGVDWHVRAWTYAISDSEDSEGVWSGHAQVPGSQSCWDSGAQR